MNTEQYIMLTKEQAETINSLLVDIAYSVNHQIKCDDIAKDIQCEIENPEKIKLSKHDDNYYIDIYSDTYQDWISCQIYPTTEQMPLICIMAMLILNKNADIDYITDNEIKNELLEIYKDDICIEYSRCREYAEEIENRWTDKYTYVDYTMDIEDDELTIIYRYNDDSSNDEFTINYKDKDCRYEITKEQIEILEIIKKQSSSIDIELYNHEVTKICYYK